MELRDSVNNRKPILYFHLRFSQIISLSFCPLSFIRMINLSPFPFTHTSPHMLNQQLLLWLLTTINNFSLTSVTEVLVLPLTNRRSRMSTHTKSDTQRKVLLQIPRPVSCLPSFLSDKSVTTMYPYRDPLP
jgi:hypothetical protein